jgi:hypothetical protein
MRTRRTDVSWDPSLVRVEYLDDKGDPFYCSFDSRRKPPGAKAVPLPNPPAAPGAKAAEALAGALIVVAVGMLLGARAGALAALLEKNGSKKASG